jgi:hypothetical protein
MTFYLGTARNLIAVMAVQGTPDSDRDAELERRRSRIGAVLSANVECLAQPSPQARRRRRTRGDLRREAELQRFRTIASIDDMLLKSWAGITHPRRFEAELAQWFDESIESLDAEVQYHHACWLAHLLSADALADAGRTTDPVDAPHDWRPQTFLDASDDEVREELFLALVDAVSYAHFVPWYRNWTFSDPELRLLAGEPEMRELALAEVGDAWDLARFAAAAAADRPVRRMPDPSLFTNSDLETLRSTVSRRELEWIADGACILRAIREAAPPEFREIDVLRVAKHLLDDENHDLRTLRACAQHRSDRLVDGIAGAVFWVPRDDERAIAEAFVAGLRDRLLEPAAAATAA